MAASRTIVDVVGRSEQGITRPFLCRADDGLLYYAKGRDAGRRSLCCEWVAGSLARGFGLPVPAFAIAEVPPIVIQQSSRGDAGDLGAGLVFASAALGNPREVTRSEAAACASHLKARILLFDWWVHNEDRSLAEGGGNPNLLVTNGDEIRIWTIDFNLAFDQDFSVENFWKAHLFAELLPAWPVGFRNSMISVLKSGADQVRALFEALPMEWLYLDGDDSTESILAEDEVRSTLARAFDHPEEFWRRA